MHPNLWPAIIGAATGGIVSVFGWFTMHVLAARRDIINRRQSAKVEHLERQIAELYGPLLGLIQHGRLAYAVARRLLPMESDRIPFHGLSDEEARVWRFFVERYFLPTNARIRDLVRGNMHLLDGGALPPSFTRFLEHQVQFEALHTLWKEVGTDSSSVPGSGWPKEFEREVQKSLDDLRSRHQHLLTRA